MAKLYNVTSGQILYFAKQIDFDNHHFRSSTLTEKDKKEICELYGMKSSTELSKIYHAPIGTITKLWHDNNLRGKLKNRYYLNFSYFENIDTKDKAYFLGFLAADGNVFKRKNYNSQSIIKLALDSKDFMILETFRKYIDSEKPLFYQDRTTSKGLYRQTVVMEIVSDKIAEDIAKYNIVPNKTYTYEIVDLDDNLMSHFIRGYFDGDGSINCDKDKLVNPSSYDISFSGFIHNLEKIQKHLCVAGIDSHIIIDKRKKNEKDIPFGALNITSIENKYLFLRYIYNDCEDLYLHRKKYIADCFFTAIRNNYSGKGLLYDKILANAVLDETNK